MVVEARLGDVGFGKVIIEVCATLAIEMSVYAMKTSCCMQSRAEGVTNLKDLSSSITWMPWSYCLAVGPLPMAAKWPFMMDVSIVT